MLVAFVVVVGIYAVGGIAFFIWTLKLQLKRQSDRLGNMMALAVAFGLFWLPATFLLGWDEWRYSSNKDWYRTMWQDWS